MLQMTQDLHMAVSLPALADASGVPYPSPSPGSTPIKDAEGISFQQWAGGPHEIKSDASAGQKVIHIVVTSGQPTPIVGQRLIVPTHQIESDIDAVSGNSSDLILTLHDNLPVPINGTGTNHAIGDVVCYITDHCWYAVANNALTWHRQGDRVMVTDITNPKPFSVPTTPAGALYYRFVAAIDLSTSDLNYSNRGYKAANILLNGQIPFKTRLTTYQ
jgi:hypothetical protein